MKFLVDNQLPPALARFMVSDLGCEAVHVADVGLGDASDADVWRYACEHNFVLISKDEDFTGMALKKGEAGGLIWVRTGNCRRTVLLEVFRRVWPRVVARLEAGDGFIELR